MELGHCESDEFLSKFVYGGNHTSLTLVSRGTFLSLLKSFITDCEDIYEKDVVMEALRDYNLSVDVRSVINKSQEIFLGFIFSYGYTITEKICKKKILQSFQKFNGLASITNCISSMFPKGLNVQ
jgi:hypothetical protein